VRAVKHLRPDVDVAVITGYGTIESAVQTMQHGAVDYVQKPFTADELAAFARKLVLKRQARLEAQRKPSVRVVAPAMAESAAANEYCVPGGAFVSAGHAWARIEPGGQVRVGIDDFARKAVGPLDAVAMPEKGKRVARGEPLFTVTRGEHRAQIPAPVSGSVLQANEELRRKSTSVTQSPYDRGWVCVLQPSDLSAELAELRIGKPVVEWYQGEIARLRAVREQCALTGAEPDLELLEREFFAPAAVGRR
jgi:glycine cleavage system H lipoate-binding protein